MYRRSQRWMLIINNRFLSLYDYNFLLVIEKIWNLEEKYVCKHKVGILFLYFVLLMKDLFLSHSYNLIFWYIFSFSGRKMKKSNLWNHLVIFHFHFLNSFFVSIPKKCFYKFRNFITIFYFLFFILFHLHS
jgi:hypothetical protein